MRLVDVLAPLPGPGEQGAQIDGADTMLWEELRVAVATGMAEGVFYTHLPKDRTAGAQVRRRFVGRLTEAGAAALACARAEAGNER